MSDGPYLWMIRKVSSIEAGHFGHKHSTLFSVEQTIWSCTVRAAKLKEMFPPHRSGSIAHIPPAPHSASGTQDDVLCVPSSTRGFFDILNGVRKFLYEHALSLAALEYVPLFPWEAHTRRWSAGKLFFHWCLWVLIGSCSMFWLGFHGF